MTTILEWLLKSLIIFFGSVVAFVLLMMLLCGIVVLANAVGMVKIMVLGVALFCLCLGALWTWYN